MEQVSYDEIKEHDVMFARPKAGGAKVIALKGISPVSCVVDQSVGMMCYEWGLNYSPLHDLGFHGSAYFQYSTITGLSAIFKSAKGKRHIQGNLPGYEPDYAVENFLSPSDLIYVLECETHQIRKTLLAENAPTSKKFTIPTVHQIIADLVPALIGTDLSGPKEMLGCDLPMGALVAARLANNSRQSMDGQSIAELALASMQILYHDIRYAYTTSDFSKEDRGIIVDVGLQVLTDYYAEVCAALVDAAVKPEFARDPLASFLKQHFKIEDVEVAPSVAAVAETPGEANRHRLMQSRTAPSGHWLH